MDGWQTDRRTYLSSRPPSPPPCGPSDGPTRCCTWSKSVWQVSLCSTDWRVYSWQCIPPRVQTGSEARAREDPRGRFREVRSDSGNRRRLSLQDKEAEMHFRISVNWPFPCLIQVATGFTGTFLLAWRCSLYRSLASGDSQQWAALSPELRASFSFQHQ